MTETKTVEVTAVAYLYEDKWHRKELVFNRNSAYARHLREIECTETPLYARLASQSLSTDEEVRRMRDGIDRALIQISGGLCYATAEGKHAQLVDADRTLRALQSKDTPSHGG